MPRLLSEIAAQTGSRLIGQNATVSAVASVQSAKAGDLVFVEQASRLDDALRSAAAAIVGGEFAANLSSTKPLLISSQPRPHIPCDYPARRSSSQRAGRSIRQHR
ncbi:MAG: hypothetical protein DMG90_18135 [Acidobacteria bacterium]|nr:MAG: hypothetical protein DMG90_18135 [Acidobacteriota bacterium]